jgi:uncharacterized membrane protein YphA (DoxX/SURF4 family)
VDTALWIGQWALAAIFLGSGTAKLTMSKKRLIDTGQTGVVFFPLPAIRGIASLELLGAIGVVLPWLTGIAPVLTPLAASGLAIVMVGAAVSHTKLREPRNVAINAVIFAVCVFVAVGRFADLT